MPVRLPQTDGRAGSYKEPARPSETFVRSAAARYAAAGAAGDPTSTEHDEPPSFSDGSNVTSRSMLLRAGSFELMMCSSFLGGEQADGHQVERADEPVADTEA